MIFLYVHLLRSISYYSYNRSIYLWFSGYILFMISVLEAFLGYILPFGQMSYWAAVVIMNILSVLPIFGYMVTQLLFCDITVILNRILTGHFVIGGVILIIVIVHIGILHSICSLNPIFSCNFIQSVSSSSWYNLLFYPYIILKDILLFSLWGFVFSCLLIGWSTLFGNCDNAWIANPMLTPIHIIPEWYFLIFYSILRSFPQKFMGIVVISLLSSSSYIRNSIMSVSLFDLWYYLSLIVKDLNYSYLIAMMPFYLPSHDWGFYLFLGLLAILYILGGFNVSVYNLLIQRIYLILLFLILFQSLFVYQLLYIIWSRYRYELLLSSNFLNVGNIWLIGRLFMFSLSATTLLEAVGLYIYFTIILIMYLLPECWNSIPLFLWLSELSPYFIELSWEYSNTLTSISLISYPISQYYLLAIVLDDCPSGANTLFPQHQYRSYIHLINLDSMLFNIFNKSFIWINSTLYTLLERSELYIFSFISLLWLTYFTLMNISTSLILSNSIDTFLYGFLTIFIIYLRYFNIVGLIILTHIFYLFLSYLQHYLLVLCFVELFSIILQSLTLTNRLSINIFAETLIGYLLSSVYDWFNIALVLSWSSIFFIIHNLTLLFGLMQLLLQLGIWFLRILAGLALLPDWTKQFPALIVNIWYNLKEC